MREKQKKIAAKIQNNENKILRGSKRELNLWTKTELASLFHYNTFS